MRTLLFDIDGTLLMTNGGGQNALKEALAVEFELDNPDVEVSFSGRTDRSLLSQLLALNGLPDNDSTHGRLRRAYTSIFPSVLERRGGYVLPGVPDLLGKLADLADIRVGVMTGNLPETATRKLEHFNLLQYVSSVFGGDMDHERDQLAMRAAKTLARRHGSHTTNDVVVIGDTPADVKCGHAIGARVVAVCTGFSSREELEAEQPSTVLDDFSDVDATCDILTQ